MESWQLPHGMRPTVQITYVQCAACGVMGGLVPDGEPLLPVLDQVGAHIREHHPAENALDALQLVRDVAHPRRAARTSPRGSPSTTSGPAAVMLGQPPDPLGYRIGSWWALPLYPAGSIPALVIVGVLFAGALAWGLAPRARTR